MTSIIGQTRLREKATKRVWLRPDTRNRIQRVQDQLNILYRTDFCRMGLGEVTASDTVDWLIYQSGIPGERGEAIAFANNIWTDFFKRRVDEEVEEDKA